MVDFPMCETMLPAESMDEITEVVDFLKELSIDERYAFLAFIQGVKFFKGCTKNNESVI